MAKVHDRILKFGLTMNAAADSVQVTSLAYFRDGGSVNGYPIGYDNTTAQTSPMIINLGELLPPPTQIQFIFAPF